MAPRPASPCTCRIRPDGSLIDFYNIYLRFIGALNQRPEIAMAYSTFNINFPQYVVGIDAAKAKRAGVSPNAILSTLSGYYGGQYVSNVNRFSKMYYVTIQSDPKYRLNTESLNNVFVRTNNGEMAPLGQFVDLTRVYSSEVLNRFNMYSSIAVNGTGRRRIFVGRRHPRHSGSRAQVLPKGYGYDFDGITREEAQTGSNTTIIFGICLPADLPHPERAVREFPDSVRRHSLRAVRSDGFVPLRQDDGAGEQHLPPDGYHHADRSAVENGHPDHGVRRRPPRRGHEPHAGRRIGRQSPSASHSDDRPHLRVRYDPLVLSHGVGANGNSTLGCGCHRRYDRRYAGAAVPRADACSSSSRRCREEVKPLEFDPDPQWARARRTGRV